MTKIAILTGDIIESSRVLGSGLLLERMKALRTELERAGYVKQGYFEIFRGDSFQLSPADPSDAMLVAIIIRAGLFAQEQPNEDRAEVAVGLKQGFDARIAIGVGDAGFTSTRISESSGEAYLLSGRRLDRMKEEQRTLAAATWDNDLGRHLDISSMLADVLISSWSANSATAVYRQLLYGENQKQTAAYLNITQPSVQNRLRIAHFEEIKRYIAYFKEVINARITDGIH